VAGVISGMLHDKDGKDGLLVSSVDHPEPWKAYGDGALDKSGPSGAQAAAIIAAKGEVDRAYEAGVAAPRSASPPRPARRRRCTLGSTPRR
jgi:hypothetical protein